MVTQQDIKALGEEIKQLIASKGIQADKYSLGIVISREEYERIQPGLAGSKVDLGHALALATQTWAIQINFPFLNLKPMDAE